MAGRPEQSEPGSASFELDAWPRGPMTTVRVELVMLAIENGKLHALMMKRDSEPCEHGLALPGQYLWEDHSLEVMARIIPGMLGIETGMPRLFGVFSQPDRDRRHRAVAVAYLCAADFMQMTSLTHQDPRFHLMAFDPNSLESHDNLVFEGHEVFEFAFDHRMIINHAFITMQDTLDHSMIAFDFLDTRFTLFELQRVHEVLLRQRLDNILFRKRMLNRRFINGSRLQRCDEQRATAGRPAATYQLVRQMRQVSPDV
jgi:8-oxo-dGTP diphosphatase